MMKKILLITAAILLLCAGLANAESNVTFGWDANTEPDLAGYRLYQSLESGNYVPTDYLEISLSVLSDPANPEYTVENLPDGEYFWVLTAYDNWGNESGYSNEVTAILPADTLPPSEPSTFNIKVIVNIVIP